MPPETVTCRPPFLYRLLAFFAPFYGLGSLWAAWDALRPPAGQAADIGSGVAFGVIGVAVLVLGLGAAAWEQRSAVVADWEGLRWRGLGRWKSARWAAVNDYYDKAPASQARQTTSVIQTPTGRISFHSQWSDADALRAVVAERAGGAGWEIDGCRASDPWSRVFGYDTFANRWTPTLLFKLFLTFIAYALVRPALGLAAFAGLVGWSVALMTALLYGLFAVPFGLLFLLPLAQARAVRRRKGQTITVSQNGIVFKNGVQHIEASWPHVTGYFIGCDGYNRFYMVRTREGDFDFSVAISQVGLLKALIQRHAQAAGEEDWKAREDANGLGGEAARWSGGRARVGARRFHYQTRSRRSSLWGPFSFGLMCLLLAGLGWQGLAPGSDWRICASGAAASFALWILMWRAYRVHAILVDDSGLTETTLLGRRFLPWTQVRDYYLRRSGGVEAGSVVVGRDARITFSADIVGREELQDEIRIRATECGGQAWEVRKPSKPTRRQKDAA